MPDHEPATQSEAQAPARAPADRVKLVRNIASLGRGEFRALSKLGRPRELLKGERDQDGSVNDEEA